MTKTEKEQAVEAIKADLVDVRHAFVIEFKGVSVPAVGALRREIRESGSKYTVVKNTLARLAITDLPVGQLSEHFTGPTAIAWHHEDPVPLAKILRGFTAKNPTVTVKGALVDGQSITSERIAEVADLPGMEQLRGRVAVALASPLRRFVSVMAGSSRGFASVLKQRADKLSE